MLLLLLILLLIATVVFIVLAYYSNKKRERDWYDTWGLSEISFILCWIFAFISAILIISIFICSYKIATESVLDEKIVMYREENSNIETEIDKMVTEYLSHEKDTLTNLKPEETSISIATLYPELNSNTLVQKQIEVYTSNNSEIKNLKMQKLDIKKTKWLLYFGK